MRRRQFIGSLCGAVAWPLAVRAQNRSVPVVGYLSSFSPATNEKFEAAFRKGLSESGFVEGRNIAIEYRLAEKGQFTRLPAMAAELIDRRVAVLFATPIPAAMAAKAAATSTPVVFAIGSDPVKMKLVASMNQPGGNATGATFLAVQLGAKRLELLREIVPGVSSVALLMNPMNPTSATQTKDMQAATVALGMRFNVINVTPQTDLDDAFATLVQRHTEAIVVGADSIFWDQRKKLIALATRHALPTMYFAREFVAAGGLISYASDYADSIRKAATYVGRILKGHRPGELPVLQPTKYELVINLTTAKRLGVKLSPMLLARADEVIE